MGCPCVHPSMRDHILKVWEHDIFHQIYNLNAVGDKDELIRF